MIQNLTYRKKNYLLLVGFILLIATVYKLSISRTLDEVTMYETYMRQIEVGNTAHSQIWEYKKKLTFYENNLGLFETDSLHNHEQILVAVSEYCQKNNLTIEYFPAELKESYGDFSLSTHKIEVRGDFKGLLYLIYHLEKVEQLGRIASVQLEKKLDKKTKRIILTAAIYLQNTSL